MFPKSEPPPALRGFEILERLGAGGAGQVFLARSRAGKLVAIKVLADVTAQHDEAVNQALSREASLSVRLQHPAIVQVRALVQEEGFAALVFEYVEGVALVRLLRFCSKHGVRLPDRAAWYIVERVLAALAYAHSQTDDTHQPAPIVHRDVSPANVLVDWSGGVKLADFGMAKMLGVTSSTRVGLVKGTLGCMSPEQARGEPVTERADVYAGALLAWRLATGRTPFAKYKDDEMELLRAMRNPRLRPLEALRPDLPEPVLKAVARALEVDAERRTITADELRAAVKSNIDVEAGHVELAELLTRWREALVKSVAREEASSKDGDARTGRYEEAALAFDDEGVLDGPTFETYSLPSDAAILATLPVDGPMIEVSMPVAAVAGAPARAEGKPIDSGPPPPPPAKAESIEAPASQKDVTTVRPPAPAPRKGAPSAGVWVALALGLAVVCAIAAYVAK